MLLCNLYDAFCVIHYITVISQTLSHIPLLWIYAAVVVTNDTIYSHVSHFRGYDLNRYMIMLGKFGRQDTRHNFHIHQLP